MIFRPKYITFDCYGTLTNFRMHEVATRIYASQLPAERLPLFIKDFAAYRLDEVMGDWKPYDQVLKSAIARTCKRHGVTFREEDGRKFYDAVPTWGPHADVPQALTRVGTEIPLAILSNAMNEQIQSNVRKVAMLGTRSGRSARTTAFLAMLRQSLSPPPWRQKQGR